MIELLTQHPVAAALVALAALAIGFGALLGFASVRYAVTGNPIVEQILEKLPQTQCGQCGHPGCRPYAEAIAAGEPINKCPPGGQATINALADLLHVEAPALDAEHGEEKPRTVAFIREVLMPGGVCLVGDADRISARPFKPEVFKSGLSINSTPTRVGEPGGMRTKGTIYRIEHPRR